MILHHLAHVDDKSRDDRQRSIAKHIVENRFELRHNEHEQEAHDRDRHSHHDNRIHHRAFYFVFDLGGFLLKLRKPVQHQLEYTTDLASLHHVDVKIVEYPRMQSKRIGKRIAALHSVSQFVDGVSQYSVAFLFCQDV